MVKGIKLCLCIMLFFAGLCSFLYPSVNGARLEAEASQSADSFIEAVTQEKPVIPGEEAENFTPYPELLAAMEDYNCSLVSEQKSLLFSEDAYTVGAINLADYGVNGNVAAVLSIPGLELDMPIYLGATAENMAIGVAVLGGTSLPIGGTDSNCILAGHRGWNGAAYFLHIDQLQPGDKVCVTNLWETLEYTVTELKTIDPYSVEEIYIEQGRDLLTLMTCDPPNTGGRYRLLVICERTTT